MNPRLAMRTLSSRLAPPRAPSRPVATVTLAALLSLAPLPSHAADPAATADAAIAEEPETDGPPATAVQVPLQTVVGDREQSRFLPAVEDVEIYEGKKTTVIDPEEPPKVVDDNYRQVALENARAPSRRGVDAHS